MQVSKRIYGFAAALAVVLIIHPIPLDLVSKLSNRGLQDSGGDHNIAANGFGVKFFKKIIGRAVGNRNVD